MTLDMKAIKNKLLLLCLSVAALAGFSSCGDEYYDYVPIAGHWVLDRIDGIPAHESEIVEFTLYSDGTGVYGQYNPYPHWSTYYIEWALDYGAGGAEYLYIYPNHSHEVWRYIVKLYSDQMKLIDLDTGQELLFYEY